MLPRLLALTILAVVEFPAFCQDKPVPEYVLNQNFPDSVLSIPVVKLDGTQGTFGDLLTSVAGKRVVLDIWASWCRDCIVGLPKLKELKAKTDPERVSFVFVSIDEDEQNWRAAINRFFRIDGEHYRIPIGWKNALSNYIVLDWVPRYLTLDETGRVIMPKAIVAEDRRLVEALKK